ncbi:MAG: hypothetical protein GX072_08750 [Lysinibacillus sp.]|nr:hypothetical protein [Lysinibacillus sp.]
MKFIKMIITIFIFFAIVAGLIGGYIYNTNWMYKYKGEFDRFFGEGNWEYVDKESKLSRYATEYYTRSRRYYGTSGEIPETYHNWYVRFYNKYGEEEYWKFTDHALKINNDKYGILSSKRFTKKQALYQDLMYLSFYLVGKEILHEVIQEVLTENEASIFRVEMSFRGRPDRTLYNYLAKQSWFTVSGATAEHYLTSGKHTFYIDIFAYDYRFQKLTEQEQQNVINSLEEIEKMLLERYGENASFSIFINQHNKVEYKDGVKQP